MSKIIRRRLLTKIGGAVFLALGFVASYFWLGATPALLLELLRYLAPIMAIVALFVVGVLLLTGEY